MRPSSPMRPVSPPPPAPLGWISLAVIGWCVAGGLGYGWQTSLEQAEPASVGASSPEISEVPPPSLGDLIPDPASAVEPPVSAIEHRARIDELRVRIVELETENVGLEEELERARAETRAFRNGAQRAVDLLNQERRRAESETRSGTPRGQSSKPAGQRARMVVHPPFVRIDEAGCFCARVNGKVTNAGKASGSGDVSIELLADGEVMDSALVYVNLDPGERTEYTVEFDLVGEGTYSVEAHWDG